MSYKTIPFISLNWACEPFFKTNKSIIFSVHLWLWLWLRRIGVCHYILRERGALCVFPSAYFRMHCGSQHGVSVGQTFVWAEWTFRGVSFNGGETSPLQWAQTNEPFCQVNSLFPLTTQTRPFILLRSNKVCDLCPLRTAPHGHPPSPGIVLWVYLPLLQPS